MSARSGLPNTDVGGKPLSSPRILANTAFLLTNRFDKTTDIASSYKKFVSDFNAVQKVGSTTKTPQKKASSSKALLAA